MSSQEVSPESPDDEPQEKTLCDRKCVHQGDRVCYSEKMTREVLQTFPEDSPHSDGASGDEDSLHSGESMFKTFSFEVSEENPDMEKCMSFWKNILAHNATPLKCTVLKPKKVAKPKTPRKETKEDEKEEKTGWLEVYKDLQRRKLDQIKLVKTKTCDPCPPEFDYEYEKKQEVEEIKKLNKWQPKSETPKVDVKSQVERTLDALQTVRSSKGSLPVPSGDTKITAPKASKPSEMKLKKKAEEVVTEEKKEPQIPKTYPKKPEPKPVVEKASFPIQEKKPQPLPLPPPPPPPEEILPKIVTEPEETYIRPPPSTPKVIIIDTPPPTAAPTAAIEPCSCGCGIQDCICADLDACLQDSSDSLGICACGCRVSECICDTLQTCSCGCGVGACICGTLDGQPCKCGCGLEECICQQLYRKSCQCGLEDCQCGEIEVLNAYLNSLDIPCKGGGSEVMMSRESQTEDKEEWVEVKQKPESYCVICGHYNCYCGQ